MKLSSLLYKIIIIVWNIIPFKKQCIHILRKSGVNLDKLENDLWFVGQFSTSVNGDKKIKLWASKGDHSTMSVFWKGLDHGWDAQSLKIWCHLAKKADVIFDVGANIGLYALTAAAMNPDSKIIAFEPGKNVMKRLKKNVELNEMNISLSEFALSNQTGKMNFYDLKSPTAVSSLKSNYNLQTHPDLVKYEVLVCTMKSFVEEKGIDKINLISIDVEMNEPEVLEGMGELIEKHKPNFIIEVLNNEVGARIEPFFLNKKYLFYSIDERDGLIKRPSLSRPENNFKKHNGFNFLICSESVAIDLNLKL